MAVAEQALRRRARNDRDGLEAALPAGRAQSCLVRVIPGVQASTHAAHAS